MSVSKDALTTPTTRKSTNSYVFSSPARDVGWSPGAANTLLGVMFPDDAPNSGYANHLVELNLSPIHRSSRFPLSDSNRGTWNTSPPTMEFGTKGGANGHGDEPSKDACASGTLPPPSSPRPFGKLFPSPLPKSPADPYQGDPCGDGDQRWRGRPGISQPADTRKASDPCLSSPISLISLPRHSISESPVKPRRVPMFPPPANPPLFAYPPNPSHTYMTYRRTKRTARSAPLSPSVCYPSAEPLEDDPFLVRAAEPAGDQLPSTSSIESRAELDPIELAEPTSSFQVTPPGESLHSRLTGINKSSKRPRIPYGRSGALGGHARGANNPTARSKATPRKDRILAAEANLSPPLLRSASSPSLSRSYQNNELEPESPLGLISNTSTQPYISPDINSHPIPRALFPTPSLTLSLDTPSTGSILPTPVHSGLFPSPDITSSPTVMRGRRGKLISRYATLEPDLIGRGELPEIASNYPTVRYTRSSHTRNRDPIIGGAGHRKEPVYEDSASKDTNYRADEDVFLVDQPSASFTHSTEPQSTSATPTSTSKDLIQSPTQPQSPTAAQSSTVKEQKSKRVREENDNGAPTPSKKTKVTGKNNPTEEQSIQDDLFELGLERTTRSQARAVAALLALSASGGNSAPKRVRARGPREEAQNEISEPKEPITPRTSNRLQGLPPSAGETHYRGTGGKNTHRVVGRAPSRVAQVPSGGNISNDTKPKLVTDYSKQAKSTRVRKAGNVDPNQGANHVLETPRAPSELLPRPDSSVVYGSDGNILRRTLPEDLPIHKGCPKWYRRHPVPAYFPDDDPAKSFMFGEMQVPIDSSLVWQLTSRNSTITKPITSWVPNKAPHFNLYTPRFMHGTGISKMALCPICVEPVWRGGENRKVTLNIKTSQYNYHMQYFHGISPKTGLPFSPPIAFRRTKRKPSLVKVCERKIVEEGKCHVCEEWIPIESIKLADVPELYWWKHAACCHGTERLVGDKNPYIEDNVYLKLREFEALNKKEMETTEELSSEGPTGFNAGVGLEDVGEPGEPGARAGAESALANQEILVGEDKLMDSDSDLTDLGVEAEDVDDGE
ncbi:unnamed protein product [Rhizoctonia solani]|uniref:Transcription regulator Rua1 C-terminal domain-containing protein n=1 Tax=Rhizoctonia solani TaxID=456999 RepID=A0A8H3I2C0_9AGAM|nr:unnamed protein product [Rhizoctonia solani]